MNDISDPTCFDMVRKDDPEVQDDLEIQELWDQYEDEEVNFYKPWLHT